MGNTSSERPGPLKGRRDSGGGAAKGEDRAKILMDSPEDADMYTTEESKVSRSAGHWSALSLPGPEEEEGG